MKSYVLLLIAVAAATTSCKQNQTEKTKTATFVLSDTMLASIRIDTATIRNSDIPEIPSSAVIFDKGKSFVMIFRDKFNINIREVKVDTSLNESSYISSGLNPGDKVISTNPLLIYDALKD